MIDAMVGIYLTAMHHDKVVGWLTGIRAVGNRTDCLCGRVQDQHQQEIDD
jgi:hypothetical protein